MEDFYKEVIKLINLDNFELTPNNNENKTFLYNIF
jgi:hypothetical protein